MRKIEKVIRVLLTVSSLQGSWFHSIQRSSLPSSSYLPCSPPKNLTVLHFFNSRAIGIEKRTRSKQESRKLQLQLTVTHELRFRTPILTKRNIVLLILFRKGPSLRQGGGFRFWRKDRRCP